MKFKLSNNLKMKKDHPRKERIIRTLKTNTSVLIASALIISGLFAYIWPRVKLVTLVYDYSTLRTEEKKLVHQNRMLKLELAAIKSLEKVEKIATEKMDMIQPEDKSIVLVKVKN